VVPWVTFRLARLNEPANAGDASRATIWQGNCHVEDQFFYSNITRAQNTIPIQYPISNCPAKPTGSFKRLYRKRARGLCSRTFIRGCASDKALTFFVPNRAGAGFGLVSPSCQFAVGEARIGPLNGTGGGRQPNRFDCGTVAGHIRVRRRGVGRGIRPVAQRRNGF